MKTCSKCNEEKPNTVDYFFKDNRSEGGLRRDCKECKRNNTKKWYESKGPEYMAWKSLKSRCHNINNDRYDNYGGRNIEVCVEWKDDFNAFLNHVGKRPSKEHSIDRINNDGDYEPGNVKWSTRGEQARNKSKSPRNTSGATGVNWSDSNDCWVARIGMEGKRHHLGEFENIEDAIAARKVGELKYWNKHS